MSEWVKSSLSNITALLTELGRVDLLSNLQRIQDATGLERQHIMRFPESDELAMAILDADTTEDLAAVLPMLASYLGASHATLHVVSERGRRHFSRRVLTTYPEEWIRHYTSRRLTFIDPVVRACANLEGEFFWDEIALDPFNAPFWDEAKAHGIGSTGFTRCIPGQGSGDVVAVSICSGEHPNEIRAAIRARCDDLATLLPMLVERFRALDHGSTDQSVTLTHDQLDLLRAIADGADLADQKAKEAASRGSLQEILRALGARTLAQAAVIAAQIGLLTNLPFSERDIQRGVLDV